MNRRELILGLGAAGATTVLPRQSFGAEKSSQAAFSYCLNIATIRGQKLGFIKELEVASSAGFRGVEIWVESLQTYLDAGGSLKEAKKRLDDLGVTVENAIGFAEWIVDDKDRRAKGLERMKREMDMLAQIGCKRTAAPPAGATGTPLLNLKEVAERYRTALELGDQTGVVPQLEMWGPSKNLGKASEVMYVAMESGHPSARVLLDIFHLYKGGSSPDTLQLISPRAIDILHMNDYDTKLPPATIVDSDRVYPGDGAAPIRRVLDTLKSPEKPLVLSVEVFNKIYYAQDALVVAKTAMPKLKAVTAGV